MSLIKNYIILGIFIIPTMTIANDLDEIIFDIEQIIAKDKNIGTENIQIIKPDNRLKLSKCMQDLTVEFPFKSHKTILVECKKPNWKFFTTFKSKKKVCLF